MLVAGYFDLLHSGHVCFLERAAEYGPLIVVVGSDQNVLHSKGRLPLCTEEERLYMVKSLRVVERAVLSPELGRLNFATTMRESKPKYFVTNADGHHESKVQLCRELGVEYVVLDRVPREGLPSRSTTAWRTAMPSVPYKVALLGGFVDQPDIGKVCPASVVVASIETDVELDRRSGMATSTRDTTIDLFGPRFPAWMTPQRLAQIVFACENPPDRDHLSGTIDVLGMFQPGVSRLDYSDGGYWPATSRQIHDDHALNWLEANLWLAQTRPRPPDMPSPIRTARPTVAGIRRMDDAVQRGFEAINRMELEDLAQAVTDSYNAIADIIPDFAPPEVDRIIKELQSQHMGAGLTGAGGGGYAVVISADRPKNGIPVRIVRADSSVSARV
ncbi:MAG: adenylyltransferase/cytidyltransferase family protein [Planctomycetota bacterium]